MQICIFRRSLLALNDLCRSNCQTACQKSRSLIFKAVSTSFTGIEISLRDRVTLDRRRSRPYVVPMSRCVIRNRSARSVEKKGLMSPRWKERKFACGETSGPPELGWELRRRRLQGPVDSTRDGAIRLRQPNCIKLADSIEKRRFSRMCRAIAPRAQ